MDTKIVIQWISVSGFSFQSTNSWAIRDFWWKLCVNILCILKGTILGCTQNWYFWILLMVRTPWGACSPKKFFWRWVPLLSRYWLPKGAKMAQMAIFTNKRNFFLRDDLKHSKNQSGPKWPHLSIFSLNFLVIWRSGPPGCGYVSSKFVGVCVWPKIVLLL